MSLVDIILAIFLPPVAVLLRTGFGGQFLINVLCTVIGWIPGIIHALWVLNKEGRLATV